jgi:ferredoxin--NADP+ reductase
MATHTTVKDPGPVLPEVQMHLHTPAKPGVGVVVENRPCTNPKAAGFIRHIAIDISNTELKGHIVAGQSFGVLPPGENERGKPHKLRLYSTSSPSGGESGDGTIVATTVKRVIDEHWDTNKLFLGVASNYLCDLKVGDEVNITGPNGKRFLAPADPGAHDYVFFATGTGIAPFRGMVLDLLKADIESKIVLVMGSPYRTDLLYDDDFKVLDTTHERFTYLTAISREREHEGRGLYVQDRIETHSDLIGSILSSERGLIYVCGIAGMELGILKQLHTSLDAEALARYLTIDPDVAGDPDTWNRKMVNRQLKPTKRVFLEVY